MPRGINSLELLRFFRQSGSAFGKSVQRPWMFWGFFMYNPFKSEMKIGFDTLNKDFPPVIQPFHIIDVKIPTYSFKKEIMYYGVAPRSFPVLNFEGFDLQVTLEEDEQGTVDYFINWLQRRIIDNEGYYNAPNKLKIPGFVLEVQDKMGIPIVYYTFHDIFFMNASEVEYSYNSNDSIKRTITFGVDTLSTVYVKQNAVAALVGAGSAALEGTLGGGVKL